MKRERKIELDQFAMDVLSKYGIIKNPAKHLGEITKGENISVLAHEGWKLELCGKIMYIDGDPVIFYNADHNHRMINFTIAHELGHYFLKHLENEKSEIVCINRDLQKSDDSRDKREVEANFFASCLLMPFNLVQPVFKDFMEWNRRYNGVLYVDKQPSNFADYKACIMRMQVHFYVSQTVIRYRLIGLGWMDFNIKFKEDEDRGISLAKYLERERTLRRQRLE